MTQQRRFPLTPYPTSWYRLAGSRDLRPGSVRRIEAFGRELALWRDRSGKAHVFDGHCPHLGVPLGLGRVQGDRLECAMHGWQYGGDGSCAFAPLARNLPRVAVRSWPVEERNGAVLVWHDAAGRPPLWQVPELPEYRSEEWSRFWRGKRWRIKTHVQEFGENGMDMAHFPHLHRQQTVGADSLGIEIDGPTLIHHVRQHHNIFGIGRRIGIEMSGTLDVHCYGLGFIANRARVDAQASLGWCVTFYFLPVRENLVEVSSFYSVRKKGLLTIPLLLLAMREGGHVIDQDVPLWEGKVYRPKPRLSDADGPIMDYRRWAEQFLGGATAESDQGVAEPGQLRYGHRAESGANFAASAELREESA